MANASRVCWRTSARVGWLASLVAATTPLISPEATCWIDTFARLGLSLVAAMRANFPSSGEINFVLDDADAALARIEATYGPGAEIDRLDGVSLAFPDWRLNLRKSNTEPVLRLNVETRGDRALLETRVAELAALIGTPGGH